MKKIVLLLMLCLPIFKISAQFQEDALCNTPAPEYSTFVASPWFGNSSFIHHFLEEMDFANYKMTYENAKYYVPIKIWVYRTDQGTGGATATEVQQLIRDLNMHNLNNNTGFLYYLKPEIGYIDKTKFQRVNFTTEAPGLSLKNSDNGCINVHIVDDLFKKVDGSERTTGAVYHSVTKSIIMKRGLANSTLPHEIGHHFGLLHPHENWKEDKCKAEAVDRNRVFDSGCGKSGLICEQNGDALCDTPAEPDLGGYSNSSCKYIGKITDLWGDAYTPNINNIMSYPMRKECRDNFTPGQIAVMLFTAKKYNECSWEADCIIKSNTENTYVFDAQEPDDSPEMASEIKANTQQNRSLHRIYSGSIKIADQADVDWVKFVVSQTTSSVEVIITNQNNYKGTIKASLLNNKLDVLSGNKITQPSELKLSAGTLEPGEYFVKIEKSGNNLDNSLFKYNFELKVN